MTEPLSGREMQLEAEVVQLHAEVAKLRSMATTATGLHAQELAASVAANLDLSQANRGHEEEERRYALLVAELNHRVKNILATVQGLAAHTLKGVGGDPRRFAQHFGARLRTLARAHDMLTELGWGGRRHRRCGAQGARTLAGDGQGGPDRHLDGDHASEGLAAPDAGPRACPPRAGHQRDQIRGALDPGGPDQHQLRDGAGWHHETSLGGDGRTTGDQAPGSARLRHAPS